MPGVLDAVPTVDDQIADAILMRQTLLERLKAGIVRKRTATLRAGLRKLLQRVERQLGAIANRGVGALSQKNFKRLVAEMQELSASAYTASLGTLSDELVELAALESAWMVETLERHVPNLRASLSRPTKAQLRRIVRARPFSGAVLRDWQKQLDADTARKVRGAIQTGVAEGQTAQQIARTLRGTKALGYSDGILPQSVRHVETITHTAVQHTTESARDQVYRENPTVVKQSRWLATLDLLTCPQCGSLDGNTWPIGKGPSPPAHPRCRCVRVAETNRVDEFAPGSTRASMDGPVPRRTEFGQWLKTRSAREQDVVLGKGRGKLFRSGKLDTPGKPLDPVRVIGANRRPLTLSQLRQRGKL